MKPKQILILSVILGVLALGILLKAWVRFAGEGESPALRKDVVVADFDPAKTERILIRRGLEMAPVELAKENGVWKIKSLWNATANPARVEKLIRNLKAVRGEFRGTGKDLFKDFGIEDTDSFSIKCLGLGDRPLLDVRIGTKQAGGEGAFVRKAASEDIYLVNVDPVEILGIYTDLETAKPASDAWTDLRLFNLDSEKVMKITVSLLKGDEKTVTAGLERETDAKDPLKSSWKFLRKDIASLPDPDKILKFIVVMNSVRAEKVVDPGGKEYGLEKPVWQLAVTENNLERVLIAGPKDAAGDRYYVRTSGGASVFSLAGSYLGDLNVDDTHFLKDVPAAAEVKKVS